MTLGERLTLSAEDIDELGHVNHARLIALMDVGRTRWLRTHVGHDLAANHVIARMEVEFLAEIRMADRRLFVHTTPLRIGWSSIGLTDLVTISPDRSVARALTTIVAWNPATRQPRPVAGTERSALAAHLE